MSNGVRAYVSCLLPGKNQAYTRVASLFRAQAQKAQGAGPRCIHSADMVKLDIQFRRMIRCVVGAPSSICWRDPWHEILHIWNQRVREMVEAYHQKTWAENCVYQHWKLACYIMSLPHERWARRMLQWQPFGKGPVGRPAMHWASKFEQFSRIKNWYYDWKNMAANCKRGAMDGRGGRFCEILYSVAVFFSHLFSHWLAPERGLPCRRANLRLRLRFYLYFFKIGSSYSM